MGTPKSISELTPPQLIWFLCLAEQDFRRAALAAHDALPSSLPTIIIPTSNGGSRWVRQRLFGTRVPFDAASFRKL